MRRGLALLLKGVAQEPQAQHVVTGEGVTHLVAVAFPRHDPGGQRESRDQPDEQATDDGHEFLYIAEARLAAIKEDYEIVETLKGADLVGKRYIPPFMDMALAKVFSLYETLEDTYDTEGEGDILGEGTIFKAAPMDWAERVDEEFVREFWQDVASVDRFWDDGIGRLALAASFKGAFKVVAADFVTTDDGTGIVHLAPAFGADDYAAGQR